ncbi:MAG TPA: hypothetical protein PKC67_03370 [Kiritimatiellia bacterium]|nr:hypothetical protein [Kiritimatiellia bacterium]HMP33367.1 hypothetical protein [Kiritimatiellia bacterium]
MAKVQLEAWQRPRAQWFFGGHDPATLTAFLVDAGMLPVWITALTSTVEQVEGGVQVYPPDAMILRMASRVRERVYRELSRHRENGLYREPLWIPAADVAYWLDHRILSADALGCLNDLIYPNAGFWLLSDVDVLMRCMTGDEERRAILRILLRHPSSEATVALAPGQDVATAIAYWRFPPGATEDAARVRLVWESSSRSGLPVPLEELLPIMPRMVLNRYVVEAEESFRDCHWTAMNFFNDRPVDFAASPERLRDYLINHYQRVVGTPMFGDVVILRNEHDDVVHSFNYIAANKVFTKNGGDDDRPWTLMPMDEVVRMYSLSDPVEVHVFRRKDMMDPPGPPALNPAAGEVVPAAP